jgi:hypothetical protein
LSQDHSPERAAWSAGVNISGSYAAVAWYASFAARPAAAARREAALEGVMPANQSSPAASYGAIPDILTTLRTRWGSRAAQARACGPPPEWPMTANRSMPRASATAETQVAVGRLHVALCQHAGERSVRV